MDRKSILAELEGDILPFWMRRMTDPKGGFLGRMNGDGYIVPGSEKGAILNSRVLWTFASAYRVLGKKGISRHGHQSLPRDSRPLH